MLLKLNLPLILLHYHLNRQSRESLMPVVLVKHHLLGTISPNYLSLKLQIQPPLATTLVRGIYVVEIVHFRFWSWFCTSSINQFILFNFSTAVWYDFFGYFGVLPKTRLIGLLGFLDMLSFWVSIWCYFPAYVVLLEISLYFGSSGILKPVPVILEVYQWIFFIFICGGYILTI